MKQGWPQLPLKIHLVHLVSPRRITDSPPARVKELSLFYGEEEETVDSEELKYLCESSQEKLCVEKSAGCVFISSRFNLQSNLRGNMSDFRDY